ncbi:MAG: ATP-binding protein [Candidatus Saccharimonas sp.]|nr:ATP-binding protein [Planctomycetaceae bacterium]
MFDVLVARSHAAVTAAELFVPVPEHAFARAALSRVTAHGKRTASFSNGLTFLSGPEGSGKSLLARQAILECLRRQPKLRYIIATAVELTDLLALADELQSLTELLELFGSLDLLVCEDFHELEGEPVRQESLLSLIDHSSGDGPRVLVTSRKLPGELRDFSQRWVSRCHGGLCATLPWPGLEARRELIARLAQARHLPLCQPVAKSIEWLAEHWAFSPRDISRSIDHLAEACHTQQAVVDIPFLERLLSQETHTVSLSLDAIATVVAHEFGVEPGDLRSRSRHQGLIIPRQCAMFLAKELTGRPLEFIGGYFGERSHTTVSHSLSRLRELLPQTPTLRQQVQKLRKRLAELKREDCA